MYDEEFIEDEEIEDDEPSLYDIERDEYYKNVLEPQINTLNRR